MFSLNSRLYKNITTNCSMITMLRQSNLYYMYCCPNILHIILFLENEICFKALKNIHRLVELKRGKASSMSTVFRKCHCRPECKCRLRGPLKPVSHRGRSEYVFTRRGQIPLRVQFGEKMEFLKAINHT